MYDLPPLLVSIVGLIVIIIVVAAIIVGIVPADVPIISISYDLARGALRHHWLDTLPPGRTGALVVPALHVRLIDASVPRVQTSVTRVHQTGVRTSRDGGLRHTGS